MGRSGNDVLGALLHNTIGQDMRERPLNESFENDTLDLINVVTEAQQLNLFILENVKMTNIPKMNVRAIVEVVRNYNDARILAKVSSGLSDMGASGMELNEINELNDAMNGVNIDENENNEGSYYILAFSIIYGCRMLMKMV
ncbi:hypothetical protein Tco_0611257 [Tanacetum coccineum]